MSIDIASSIDICPINFERFGNINRITKNTDASLLFAKLKFHQVNSKIKKNGKICIVRSRSQIASWFGYSTKKVDSLLSSLEEKGLIEKRVSLWYGERRLFITTSEEIENIPINLKLIDVLTSTTGSVRAALIFSKIAFSFANTKINNENKKWCCLTKQDLADWSGVSIRTIDATLKILERKGLILKKNFSWRTRVQSHFHIPDFVIKTLKDRFELKKALKTGKTSPQKCRATPAKKGVSIRIRTNLKKTNNITVKVKSPVKKYSSKSDINFDFIGDKISERQVAYIKSALKRTLERKNIKISNPKELLEELLFSTLNPDQHKGIKSFRHVVSRFMKIISDGNWRSPKGFYSYSEEGKAIKEAKKRKEFMWLKLKERERERSILEVNIAEKTCFLTQKAISIASQIIKITKASKKGSEKSTLNFIEDLTSQILSLIGQGADKETIAYFLKKNKDN